MSDKNTKEEKHKRLIEAIDLLRLYDKEKMSQSTNTNITLLYNYLNGKREIGEKFAVALYRAYGISVSFILEGKKPILIDIKEDLMLKNGNAKNDTYKSMKSNK